MRIEIIQQIKMRITIITLLFSLIACSKESEEKVILFEMRNFDKELQECICGNLNKKWIDCNENYLITHSEIETFKGESLSDKITFKDITDIKPNEIEYGTEKLILSINFPDVESDSIVVNIQQFLLEENTQWKRILNMGNFTLAKDKNICESILKLGLIAQCK